MPLWKWRSSDPDVGRCGDCGDLQHVSLLDAYAEEEGQDEATAFLCKSCHNARPPSAWGEWREQQDHRIPNRQTDGSRRYWGGWYVVYRDAKCRNAEGYYKTTALMQEYDAYNLAASFYGGCARRHPDWPKWWQFWKPKPAELLK